MVDILYGMVGGALVIAAYAFGVYSGRKTGLRPEATEKAEEKKSGQLPIEEQFANLMNYDGRGDR